MRFEEFLTGVEKMDQQHKRLFELLEKVECLLKNGQREKAMELLKEETLNYLNTHLGEEEEFMRSINYPELDNHKKIHDLFKKEMIQLVERIHRENDKAFREALAYLRGWLCNHILKTDRKYGIYAKEKGLV